ncbi:hypothetical protein ABFV83_02245 [Lacrimispora sp. BS-2]|uniref:Uncharacterized protein n=1 Tax=Lacrimispora sp. BS-2 TaxID=3151850 RepID=A0AAU7PSD2_9FIRM
MTDKKYCIQLAECDGNSKEVYSFDEVEIGTWVDGKPIYRKVISGTLTSNSGNSIVFASVSELNIERLINLYGNMIDKNNRAQITLQTSYDEPGKLVAAVNMFYDNADGSIYYHLLNNNGKYSGCTAYVVIEYTKK